MERMSTSVAVLAGGATLLLSSVAFITSPGAPRGGVPRVGSELRGSAPPAAGSRSTAGPLAVALPLAALGALAAGAKRRSGREGTGRVATQGVLTTDNNGRFRFDVPAVVLNPADQVGVTKPMNFFDPLGFTKGATVTYPDDPNGFKFLRSAELKNGRVAMMASVGLVAQHYIKLPGFEDVPAGLGALTTSQGANGFAAIVILVGFLEVAEYTDGTFRTGMGNYGDPLNLGNYNKEYQNKELNNCRMAMFAVLGQLTAEIVTGKDAVQQMGM